MTSIAEIHLGKAALGPVSLNGWVKTHRQSKNVSFIELTDGSSVNGVQLVIEPTIESYQAVAARISTGASIGIAGELVPSPAKGQRFEIRVSEINLIGECDPEHYPLQKKGHSLEFLREHIHLRPRSNTLGAVFRIRSIASQAIHSFFQSRDFVYLTSPIITTADCEGAGEMFHVTNLDLENPPRDNGKVNYREDFFGEPASLTVSGQLEGEIFATAFTRTYTFGPTFRAENSNTTRHLAEFWMVEPEVAFADLEANMKLAENFVRTVIREVLDRGQTDLEFLHAREWCDKELLANLELLVGANFKVLEYTDAIEILSQSKEKFEYPVKWGIDLQSEHERYLTDVVVQGPAFVINYPKEIKAFYMRLNDDGKTVRAMDLLVPRLGEIIGGSQREERSSALEQRMNEMKFPVENYQWYLDLRRFGTVPHAGFGLGFERLLMYLTGMQNIRDVIPFPRYPGFAKF